MFTRRTRAELLYVLASLPLCLVGFVVMLVPLGIGLGLSVAFIGVPILAFAVLIARGLGNTYRGMAGSLLALPVAKPDPPVPTNGVIPAVLRNAASWRAVLYVILKLPVGLVTFVLSAAFWVYGFFMLSHVTYWFVLSEKLGLPFTDFKVDTWPNAILLSVVGAALLWTAPRVTHALLLLDRMLIRGLLGRTTLTQRVRDLEETRAHAVDDAAARLRQIERDLHDGTQARMVALAMHLGMVKEELDGEPDLEMARKLVDLAHANAKEALVEVRDLARGIHPAALDKGLDAALATLASRSPIPVALDVSLDARPPQAIEMIAYFCTAELLTNIAKHSEATSASVTVAGPGPRIEVTDNGIGGAAVKPGAGLAGVRERVATVDGTMAVDSPPGGPTKVVISFPA